MCGIAGIFSLEQQPLSSAELIAMTEKLRHRGPDDEGFVLIASSGEVSRYSGDKSCREISDSLPSIRSATLRDWQIGLAHTRFSIIDLSSNGHQPFFDSQQRCCVVFNGEIYNYLELRTELESLGVQFRTASDTEVIVEAYAFWGTDCFQRFNGMWAIALYDCTRKKLILCRDRLGELPLYWTIRDSKLYFASEIKGLLAVESIARSSQIQEAAIVPFLFSRNRDLDDTTFFEGVFSFPKAYWAEVDARFPATGTHYWHYPTSRLTPGDIDIATACSQLQEALISAVDIRMRADVPLCLQLSGGLDSSIVTACAHQTREAKDIDAYVVRVPESDEEPFARMVASRYGCNYHVIDSVEADFWQEMPRFTYIQEEPYVSPVLFSMYSAQRRLCTLGHKVFLSGIGGDELFAGYRSFVPTLQLNNLVTGHWGQYFRNSKNWTEEDSSGSAHSLTLRQFVNGLEKIAKSTIRQLVSKTPRSYYLDTLPYVRPGLPLPKENIRGLFSFNEAARMAVQSTLLPYWLRSDDKSMLSIPVEKRSPFLDHRVVELAAQLPAGYLFRDGWQKWILRKAFEKMLPEEVCWRKQKLGFPFPDSRFRQEHAHRITTLLAGANNPYIDTDLILKNSISIPTNVMNFLLWYELFFNKNDQLLSTLASNWDDSGSHLRTTAR